MCNGDACTTLDTKMHGDAFVEGENAIRTGDCERERERQREVDRERVSERMSATLRGIVMYANVHIVHKTRRFHITP